MAVDTPARIAVLGAGPIGLEAALYARFLGYDVVLLERGVVANHVQRWGHVQMFSPFRLNRSPLGLAALRAQSDTYQAPADEALLTGHQWREQYLLPLAETDLLADCIRTGTTVRSISRLNVLKHEAPGSETRAEHGFRILATDSDGSELIERADVVVDATGVFGQPNRMGPGGGPAVGERQNWGRIWHHLPDIKGGDQERFAGRRTLLVGSGYSAATSAVALAELANAQPATTVTWVTRRPLDAEGPGPVPVVDRDPLEQRQALAAAANRCTEHPRFILHPGCFVERIEWREEQASFRVVLVRMQEDSSETIELDVDEIVANVGYRPDLEPLQELQLQLCYATEGPLQLAAELLGQPNADCLSLRSSDADALRHPERDVYVLGAKSYGRNSQFLFAAGLQQIRLLFSVIGDRSDLDLYRGASLLPQ